MAAKTSWCRHRSRGRTHRMDLRKRLTEQEDWVGSPQQARRADHTRRSRPRGYRLALRDQADEVVGDGQAVPAQKTTTAIARRPRRTRWAGARRRPRPLAKAIPCAPHHRHPEANGWRSPTPRKLTKPSEPKNRGQRREVGEQERAIHPPPHQRQSTLRRRARSPPQGMRPPPATRTQCHRRSVMTNHACQQLTAREEVRIEDGESVRRCIRRSPGD